MSKTSALREMIKNMESQMHIEGPPLQPKVHTVELRLGTIEIPLEVAPGLAYAMASERTKSEKAFVRDLIIRAAKRHLRKVAELGLEVPQVNDAKGEDIESIAEAVSEPKRQHAATDPISSQETATPPQGEPREEPARSTAEPAVTRSSAPPERNTEANKTEPEENPCEEHPEIQKKRRLFSLN